MNTAGNLFWTNVTEMLKDNKESLRSVALYMRDGVSDKKTQLCMTSYTDISVRQSIRQMFQQMAYLTI